MNDAKRNLNRLYGALSYASSLINTELPISDKIRTTNLIELQEIYSAIVEDVRKAKDRQK